MDLAASLCDRTGRKLYAHVAFWEYLFCCPAPTVNDLPNGAELIVFRQANNDACHDPLLDAFNRMEETIILFGTEKGAYTGAENRAGLFEQANGGTLLLDEINSMNISLQAKLLRVLQDGMVRRVGGMTETHIDVRALSNINIPPNQAIEEHKLRLDLFYRLGVVNIHIPPLRERKEDIGLLAKQFILQLDKKLRKNVRDIDEGTLRRFREYDWPGSVRELQHAIEHAMNVIPNDMSIITPEYIPWHVMTGAAHPKEAAYSEAMPSLEGTMQDIERRTICKALRASGGNISEAARNLNMSRQNLQYRIKRHKIDIPALLRQE